MSIDDNVRMSADLEAIKHFQELCKKYAVEGSSWSQQLIIDRRLEGLGECEHSDAAEATRRDVEEKGFAICEGLLPVEVADRFIDALGRVELNGAVRRRGGVFAVRNLLDVCPEVESLAYSRLVRHYVEPILGGDYFVVRGILFDKIPGANWKVPWHQDMTIAVKERVDVAGYGPWSVKADVQHVQPPASVLEKMLTLRFHLDDCDADNGALRVSPGSHAYGKIPEQQLEAYREGGTEQVCAVRAGGVLLMRPLLLHASSPSVEPKHRRVIHLDFATGELDGGLAWSSE